MKLSQLKTELGGQMAVMKEDAEFFSVSFDSKNTAGSLYFCLVGALDGHDFADEAQKNGAVAVVCTKTLRLEIPTLLVKDTRQALATASAALNGHPQKKLKMVGLTGTNGKTTTSYILSAIFAEFGKKCGIIGTNGAVFGNKTIELSLTTPDPPQLFSILRQMAQDGVEYVFMEVSAHALALEKVKEIVFDVAAFTNLSRDHLDYFKDLSTYAAAKARLFSPFQTKSAVINVDDDFGKALAESCGGSIVTYGCDTPADVFAIDLRMSVNGLEYVLNLMDEVVKIKFSMTGRFNMYNTLCAAAVSAVLGVPTKTIAEGIRKLMLVDGRYNIINATDCSVIIDFAHTDDGLRNIISSIREYATGRIITVFGCGGDRDRTKRPLMGAISSALSDYCIITSDNPRSEQPESIIGEIAAGASTTGRGNFVSVPDRKEAIKQALTQAKKGDIVLIAGKGAEKTQEIMGVKHQYNDRDYVLKLIDELHL